MKALVVIDMQKDFIDGSLGTKEALAIVNNVKEKIDERRKENYEIIFTKDTHYENYLETSEGKNLPVVHCVKGTEGHEISPALNTEDAVIFEKPTFGSLKLGEYLSGKKNLEEVELVGLCTDICVVSNALILKAIMPEAEISVDSSCCAGVTPESHNAALDTMKMCQIKVN